MLSFVNLVGRSTESCHAVAEMSVLHAISCGVVKGGAYLAISDSPNLRRRGNPDSLAISVMRDEAL